MNSPQLNPLSNKLSNELFNIYTFGCKVNTYDSGLLEKRLEKYGFLLDADKPKVHVLNTCAVTQEATREAVRTVRRLKIKNPNSVVVVTGCAAQVDTDAFSSLPGVDLVIANSHKGQLENIIADYLRGDRSERVFKSNIFKKEDLEAGGGIESAHTRSFLKIQDGCNSFCTYCVIPFARGKSRSLSIESICERILELESQGVKEVVLTGIHIGDYEYGLENLVESILKKTSIARIRLTSLEPQELTNGLLDYYQDDRMCPHFHMSIQSASTPVLHRMKRQYGAQDVADVLLRIESKLPKAYVGMDVIVGFPGEGESEFLETYKTLSSLPWTKIHVFPYSERPGTYAIRLDQKNKRSEIVRRAERLRALSYERFKTKAEEQLGCIKKVLLFKNKKGLSRDFWPVTLEDGGADLKSGTETLIKITGYNFQSGGTQTHLKGQIFDAAP